MRGCGRGLEIANRAKRVVKSMYKTVIGKVEMNGGKLGYFMMNKAIKQGDSLGPLLP